MALDPQLAAMLAFLADSRHPPMHLSSVADARAAMRAMTCGMVAPGDVVPVGSVVDRSVPGGAGARPARLYRPEGAGPWPTTVFLHGGGFVVGDLDTHDQVCRRLCRDAATVVLSVDYRLAPEHRFPGGLEDALAATRWAAGHLAELGGTPVLGVGGDSAGGNLAAVVAQAVPDLLAAQLLLYPPTDVLGDYPSRTENAEGYLLELALMEWFFDHYVGGSDGVDPADPRISPLRAASLADLPAAVVVTAEFDPLRDEGEAYAVALDAAGVPVHRRRYDGLIHGFLDLAALSTATEAAVAEVVGTYRTVLHGAGAGADSDAAGQRQEAC